MLFNSYPFIFGFFPLAFAGFFLIARYSHAFAAGWLALVSLFFYGWWSIHAVPLILGSACVNYYFGKQLTPFDNPNARTRKVYLCAALIANLALLGFFKYADFFIANANLALDVFHEKQINALHVVLPIGISFYTFTQIAFLVDCWQGKVRERNFTHYLLFVTYFPHLIAGPVLHHSQMMPQFAKPETYRLNFDKLAIGITVFTIGLAKKLLIADPLGEHADALFSLVGAGSTPQFFASWFGVLAYTFQIYFDFSGYTDMAIGLSLFFGIRLPINFYSPYKATSIIDFWRRWHISLSTFLKDYLYIPLGGNRLGTFRRYVNLLVTMLLGGLWHGANWTFVLWGAVHGMLLAVNHAWRELAGGEGDFGPLGKAVCWLATFVSVCFAWVLFRAKNIADAETIYSAMLGFKGIEVSILQGRPYVLLLACLAISILFRNSTELFELDHGTDGASMAGYTWLGIAGWAIFVVLLFNACIYKIGTVSTFLYFQF
jgi:alginate O-acetyltransferase complex protein AlgI